MEEQIFDSEFFRKLNSIHLTIRMRLSQGAQGGRKSHAKGTSVEFSDFREYVQGDDFRRIDWNAYGRFDKLFVKLFMEEREALFNLFIDRSKSMEFGQKKKSIMSLRIAAALSYIVLNHLDRICINLLQDSEIQSTKSSSGKAVFQKLLKELSNIHFDGGTDLNRSIKKKELKAKGVSIVISDFFNQDSIEEALKYLLYKKQEVILVHILSREEINPEFDGVTNLIDAETGEDLKVSLTPAVLKEYNKQLQKFMENIESMAAKLGVGYIRVVSDEPLEKVVLNHFTLKGLIQKV